MLENNNKHLLLSRNQQFCYWLQGYFEITEEPLVFTQDKIELIIRNLNTITEPLGDFTKWLHEVCTYLQQMNYKEKTMAYFLPIIQANLNSIFLHVIDESYNSELSSETLQMIHDGKI